MIFNLILFFHCGVARDRGSRVFFNMLKGAGREFFFFFFYMFKRDDRGFYFLQVQRGGG
jgi:hypothetical protein